MRYRRARGRKGQKKIPTMKKAMKQAVNTVRNARINAVVKRVLGQQRETKCIQLDGTLNPVSLQASTASIASNNICITPISSSFTNTNGCLIGEGVGQDQRIGDEICVKAYYFNYALFPLPYNATTNSEVRPIVATIYIVRPKNGEIRGPALQNYVSGTSSIFFENQTNSGCGFVGNLTDLVRKIDKDNYEVLAVKQHKLFYAGTSGTGTVGASYGFANNDFSFMAQGRVKITAPKNIKYDRVGDPKNQAIYAILQWQYADNTIAPSTRQALQWTINTSIYYTDA